MLQLNNLNSEMLSITVKSEDLIVSYKVNLHLRHVCKNKHPPNLTLYFQVEKPLHPPQANSGNSDRDCAH